MEDDDIECNGVDQPIFIDEVNGLRFWVSYQASNLMVTVGDCVRVSISREEDVNQTITNSKKSNKTSNCIEVSKSTAVSDIAFGQILAIYEEDEVMSVEIRWFYDHEEATTTNNVFTKQKMTLNGNELVETDIIDDIPAGAVNEIIEISNLVSKATIGSNKFLCRYMVHKEWGTVEKVLSSTILERGMSFSHYKHAYLSYLSNLRPNVISDPYTNAIKQLHISVIPDSLPCRSEERKKIENYIINGIKSHGSCKPIYISGMPGTGKTATVSATINGLKNRALAGEIGEFYFININCLKLQHPTDAYTVLWRGLMGMAVNSKRAKAQLDEYFNDHARTSQAMNRKMTVCLVDEMDYLLTKDYNVLYNLFNWPLIENSSIVLIGIANTMDLPERLTA
eukprot:gene9320-12556_t